MNTDRCWITWWALPWRLAHPDWARVAVSTLAPETLDKLGRHQHALLGRALAIEPCLPPPPHLLLLELLYMPRSQQDLVLALVDSICRPKHASQLCTEQRLWCQRVAKALRPHTWHDPDEDTLQLLRSWVEPPVWQRLRLHFAHSRILALERQTAPTPPSTKLQVLWPAVIWRSKQISGLTVMPTREVKNDASATQD